MDEWIGGRDGRMEGRASPTTKTRAFEGSELLRQNLKFNFKLREKKIWGGSWEGKKVRALIHRR